MSSHDFQRQLADAVRKPIADFGQAALSRETGIAQPSISAWLAGRRSIPLERISDICRALGLELRFMVVKPQRVLPPGH